MADEAKRLTSYVILRENEQGYELVGTSEATSAKAAIQKSLGTTSNIINGNYYAIPSRSFQPYPVSVKLRDPEIVIGESPAHVPTTPPDTRPLAQSSPAVEEAAREMRRQLEPELSK